MQRIAIALGVLAAACGTGGGDKAGAVPEVAGACDRRAKESICAEYHGAVTTEWVQRECPAYGAPFVARCPVEGALVRCVRASGAGAAVHELWYPPATRDTATAMCRAPEGELRDP